MKSKMKMKMKNVSTHKNYAGEITDVFFEKEVVTSFGTVCVNCQLNCNGNLSACVMVGGNEPGWRLKDDSNHPTCTPNKVAGVASMRRQIREEVAADLEISLMNVRAQAVYSRLQPQPDGMIKDVEHGSFCLPA